MYESGKLIYDGNYKQGIQHGKVKEYNNEGELIFEGEYINGKKNENKANKIEV